MGFNRAKWVGFINWSLDLDIGYASIWDGLGFGGVLDEGKDLRPLAIFAILSSLLFGVGWIFGLLRSVHVFCLLLFIRSLTELSCRVPDDCFWS